MNLTKNEALIIMGALSVSYGESLTGIGNEFTIEEFEFAEINLIKKIYTKFPLIVKQYSWLPSVKKVLNNES